LTISSVHRENNKLKFQLISDSLNKKAHVIARHFIPKISEMRVGLDLFETLKEKSLEESYGSGSILKLYKSIYLSERKLGDELLYINERRRLIRDSVILPGNMLTRPSLLLDPFEVGSSITTVQSVKEGEAYHEMADFAEKDVIKKKNRSFNGGNSNSDPDSILDFLSHPSLIICNLIGDADGIFEVDVPNEWFSWFQIVGSDSNGGLAVYNEFGNSIDKQISYLDTSHKISFPIDSHSFESQQVITLEPNQNFFVGPLASTKIALIDKMNSLMNLFSGLPKCRSGLNNYSFLIDWHSFSDEEKITKLSDSSGHEINFFIYQHDRPFFDSYISPFLKSKKSKTLIDHWLLGQYDKVSLIANASGISNLNAFEKCLAASCAQTQESRIAISESIKDLTDEDNEKRNALLIFKTVLQSKMNEEPIAVAAASAPISMLYKSHYMQKPPPMMAMCAAPPRAKMEMSDMLYARSSSIRSNINESEEENDEDWGSTGESDAEDDSKGDLRQSNDQPESEEEIIAGVLNRKPYEQVYKDPGPTKIWKERNYCDGKSDIQISSSLFWADYGKFMASNDVYSMKNNESFLTSNIRPPESVTEAILMLGCMNGLTFSSYVQHQWPLNNGEISLIPSTKVIAFHEMVTMSSSTELSDESKQILVGQIIFDPNEENGKIKAIKNNELVSRKIYACRSIVTNVSSEVKNLKVMYQIPIGSCPLQKGTTSIKRDIKVESYRAWTEDCFFYFPRIGSYQIYPLHVFSGSDNNLCAFANPQTISVVKKLSEVDETSWATISSEGTIEQVVSYLKNAKNLNKVNLDLIRSRLVDSKNYSMIVDVLEKRCFYSNMIWSYSLMHRDLNRMKVSCTQNWLKNGIQLGPSFKSHIINIDNTEYNEIIGSESSRLFQYNEFFPIMNARSHQLGVNRVIPNESISNGYKNDIAQLLFRDPSLTRLDLKLTIIIGLISQDRIFEAINMFEKLKSSLNDDGNKEFEMQIDYLDCYLLFFQLPDGPKRACDIARKYVDQCAISFWRKKFTEVFNQVMIQIDPNDKTFSNDKAVIESPTLELSVEKRSTGTELQIHYTKALSSNLVINYYLVDVELLFSTKPFGTLSSNGSEQLGQFASICPNRTVSLQLAQTQNDKLMIPIPSDLSTKNIMIELQLGNLRRSQMIFSTSFRSQVIENFGQVLVLSEAGLPLSGVYIKAYARLYSNPNKPMFWKDGYTDFRGRFDYASLNIGKIKDVERFSLFISSSSNDHQGSIVIEVLPPLC